MNPCLPHSAKLTISVALICRIEVHKVAILEYYLLSSKEWSFDKKKKNDLHPFCCMKTETHTPTGAFPIGATNTNIALQSCFQHGDRSNLQVYLPMYVQNVCLQNLIIIE